MKTLIIGANAVRLYDSNPGKVAVLDERQVLGDRAVTRCCRSRA